MKYFLFSVVITTLLFLFHKPITIHAAETYIPPGSSSGPVKTHIASMYNKTRSDILYLFPRRSTTANYNLLDRIYYLHVDMIEELDPKKQTLIWIFGNMYFVFLSVYFALLAALVTWEGFSKLVVVKWLRSRIHPIAEFIRSWRRHIEVEPGTTKAFAQGAWSWLQNFSVWLWNSPVADIFRRYAAEFVSEFVSESSSSTTDHTILRFCLWILRSTRQVLTCTMELFFFLKPRINKTRTFVVAATILYFCVACSIDLWKMAEAILALVVLALYVLTLYGPYRLLGITPMEMQVRRHALVFEGLIRRYGLHMVVRILGSMDTRAESILLAELSDLNRIPIRPWHLYVVEWEETVAYRLGMLAAREYDSAHPIMMNDPWTRDDNKLPPLEKAGGGLHW